jgi:hypothetical protein
VEHIKGIFRTEAVNIFRTAVVIRGKADVEPANHHTIDLFIVHITEIHRTME